MGTTNFVLFAGGEAISEDLARELTARTREAWNMYGPPTEATICVSGASISRRRFTSVNRPPAGQYAILRA